MSVGSNVAVVALRTLTRLPNADSHAAWICWSCLLPRSVLLNGKDFELSWRVEGVGRVSNRYHRYVGD